VVQSLQRWWPPVARFCRGLELELGHPVQANAYLTPGGARGLAPHHDTHDVFVLQVAGTKHWTIAEPVVDTPLPRHRSDHGQAAAQPALFDAAMTPGDCLYLPRGFVHSAQAQQGVSLHITVGVLATTVHDALRRLVERAADEPAFRRALPPGFAADPEVALGAVKSAVGDLLAWLEKVDPEEVAGELRDRFWSRRTPLLQGHLLDLAELDALDDATVVRHRAGAPCALAGPEGGRLALTLGDRRLDLPAAVGPAVRRLLDGRAQPVSALADLLDGPSRVVLARRLVREGLLEIDRGG